MPRDLRLTRAVLGLGLGIGGVGGVGLVGCGVDGADGRDDPGSVVEDVQVQLEGRAFVTDLVEGRELVPGTSIRLSFEDGVLAASAGCNTMSGTYVDREEVLAWSAPPVSTRMACDPASTEQDAWVAGLLTDGMEIDPGDADLVLVSGDVRWELSEE